jgi:Ca2+-binding EF-hand superfamily protein
VPFGNGAADENAIFRAIQTEDLKFGAGWASITGAAKELIAGCLEKDPSKRYTVEQALDHPWVSGDAASDRPIDRSIVEALVAFNARNKFKKAAISLVASNLTAKDVQDMRAAFMRIDKDNSGTITHAELVNAMREMGMGDKADFRALVESVDVDKDGLVSWEVCAVWGWEQGGWEQGKREGRGGRARGRRDRTGRGDGREKGREGERSCGRAPVCPSLCVRGAGAQEFLHATLEAQMVKHQQKIWEAFCEMDTDGSGTITVDELRRVLKDEPSEMIEKYIAEYDLDKVRPPGRVRACGCVGWGGRGLGRVVVCACEAAGWRASGVAARGCAGRHHQLRGVPAHAAAQDAQVQDDARCVMPAGVVAWPGGGGLHLGLL